MSDLAQRLRQSADACEYTVRSKLLREAADEIERLTSKPTPNEDDWKRAAEICREVAALPDRTSPDNNADFILVTAEELSSILAEAFAKLREADESR